MKEDRNRQLIQRFYYELWNRFDKTIFDDFLTADLRFRGSLGQVKNGYTEFGEYVDFIRRTFPDFSNEVEEIISEEDKALRQAYLSGHPLRRAFWHRPPTRRVIQYAGAAVFKFRGGRIAEVWVLGDIYGLINQLEAK